MMKPSDGEGTGPGGDRRGRLRLLYTGHGDLWKNSVWKSMSAEQRNEARAKFIAGELGFGRSACEYMVAAQDRRRHRLARKPGRDLVAG